MFFPVSNLTKDRGGGGCAWFAVVVDFLALPFPQSPCSAMHLVHERSFKRGKPATSQPPAEITVVVDCSAVPFSPGNPADRLVHHRSCLPSRAFLTVKTRPRT